MRRSGGPVGRCQAARQGGGQARRTATWGGRGGGWQGRAMARWIDVGKSLREGQGHKRSQLGKGREGKGREEKRRKLSSSENVESLSGEEWVTEGTGAWSGTGFGHLH
ncbi:hypothetical protein KC19_8G199300 [Ceratodon purpureus]|uniref:Uncharacterized protein n=1 Tax=Ceratodon purpureus TaxID=3225 RepID=A0A8T0H0Y1_CERPU|nr:hypothetical protein KC19_8G199300 [Ceratodon purpureus]